MIPFANTSVTIYNKVLTVIAGKTVVTWVRHVVGGCFWNGTRGRNYYGNDDNKSYSWTCKIPKSEDYVAPIDWNQSVSATHFTLQPDDVIVRGSVNDPITSLFTINDLKSKYRAQGVMTIGTAGDYSQCVIPHYLALGV